jgi:hypothetical protein
MFCREPRKSSDADILEGSQTPKYVFFLGDLSVFWFDTPASMMGQHDSMTYSCARNESKRRLITLSLSKTVQVFVGALPWTIFPGYFQPLLFVH